MELVACLFKLKTGKWVVVMEGKIYSFKEWLLIAKDFTVPVEWHS